MAHDPEKDASAAELLPSGELLAFYKSRLDDFDKERSELLERIDRCAAQKAEIHSLEWENRKRAQEIQELQKALSDAHCYLFEERERLLQLQAENDELRLQEVEDRKRIQHLLSLTQPVEQEITYFREAKPDSVTVYPRENVPPRDNQAASSGKAGGSERVIRTIYLPSANADTLLLKVESLQSQLNEQRQLAAERLAALQEDRRIREQDEAAHQANYMKQVEQLTAKLRRCEDTLRQTTKDYILARREKQQAEQRAVTADAQLAQDRQKLTEQIQQLQRSSREQLSRNKEDSSKKMEEYIQTFRQQVKQREEEIANLESVHSTVKIQYERRISELEAKLTRMSEKCKQAEYRRSLEAEGFTNDVTLLRKQLAAVDRKLHQMRLVDRLQDDERLDALLSHLEKKAPSVSRGGPGGGGDDDASSLASETSAVAQDLRRIKGTILGLEERLRGPSRRRS